MLLETCLSILTVAEKATKIYDWFTGVSSGGKMNATINSLSKSKSNLHRLSDRVLYAPDLQQAINMEGTKALTNEKKIHDLLNPVAEALDTEVLASAVISTPEKLRNAFKKDPWELLLDIRPVSRTKKPSNPDLVPITFFDNDLQYIGWQTRGALPSLFNCDFEYNGTLLVPNKQIVVPSKEPKESSDNLNKILYNELLNWFRANAPLDDLHIEPMTPARIYHNSRSKFDPPCTDIIVATIDCTVSKSGSDFLAFGLKGIYYHNDLNGSQTGFHFISYQDFPNRTFSTKWLFEVSFDKGDSLDCSGCSTGRKI